MTEPTIRMTAGGLRVAAGALLNLHIFGTAATFTGPAYESDEAIMSMIVRMEAGARATVADGRVIVEWAATGDRLDLTPGGPADFDLDGDAGTDADIEAFYACLAAGCPGADYDGDGDAGTDADVAAFWAAIGGGE